MWDPHVGAGTVPHQQIGYLFPMGPWFWLFQRLGDTRLGGAAVVAGHHLVRRGAGVRWLFTMLGTGSVGALAGAIVYTLSPYQLAFTSGLSVLLLPWAGLPWLVGLTMRSVRRGGWRDPALFALVVLTIGGINASALVLAGIGPLLWLVFELLRDRSAGRAVAAATARIAVLTVGVSLWWIVGLQLQGAYGLPVLRLTESLSTVADHSSPDDLLRGIGNWLLYATDNTGYAIDQADGYATGGWVGVTSYAIPVAALLSAARDPLATSAPSPSSSSSSARSSALGAWPYDHPSAYGALWKGFASAISPWPRVAKLASGGAGDRPRRRRPCSPQRWVPWHRAVGRCWPESRSSRWPGRPGTRLADRLPLRRAQPAGASAALRRPSRRGGRCRRERHPRARAPGLNFAAYTWGNTVEPVTPGLTNRPYLTA